MEIRFWRSPPKPATRAWNGLNRKAPTLAASWIRPRVHTQGSTTSFRDDRYGAFCVTDLLFFSSPVALRRTTGKYPIKHGSCHSRSSFHTLPKVVDLSVVKSETLCQEVLALYRLLRIGGARHHPYSYPGLGAEVHFLL